MIVRQTATFVRFDPARDQLDALPFTHVTVEPAAVAGARNIVDRIDWVLRDPLVAGQTRTADPLTDPLAVPPHAAGDPAAGRPEHAALPAPTAHVDKALADVRRWLGVGLKDACDAAGIDRGTVYAWRRRGSEPRPGTIGAVLRLYGLASSAVRAVGEDRTREWFHAGDPSPVQRLVAAGGDPAVLTGVGRELRRALTGPPLPPPNPLLAATADDTPARPLV
jgi:hypothetical protein